MGPAVLLSTAGPIAADLLQLALMSKPRYCPCSMLAGAGTWRVSAVGHSRYHPRVVLSPDSDSTPNLGPRMTLS
jgi:hypothetical protein